MRSRLGLVVVALAVLAIGAWALLPSAPPPASAPPPTPPAAGSRVHLASAADCGKCHQEIYREWRASYHGRAMDDPLFLDLSADVDKEECIRCHAPVPIREVDFQTPIARVDRREDAISCLSCHETPEGMAGPFGGLSGACRPVQDPDQQNVVKICAGCHNQHDTVNEWQAGPYSPEAPAPRQRPATTCLECHMPAVERPLVEGGPVRKGRRHTWPGGHEMSQLKKAATLEVEVLAVAGGGFSFRPWVTNVGAGHNLPTDARHRSFDVYVKVWDAEGRVLLDPLDPNQQERAHTAKYRKNYRGTGLVDTQVPPLARVAGLSDRWKGAVDVPEAVRGRGEAWLVYRLTPSDVLEPQSLEDLPLKLYRARVVLRTPFTYGD